jgi:ZIP family zinc transporter
MPELDVTPQVPPRRSRPEPRSAGLLLWLKGLAPLALLAVLVAVFIRFGPLGVFQKNFPPVEVLTIERIRLPDHGVMEVQIVNGGPEPVTIAQVMVDDANWVHRVDGNRTVERLERRTITIPYPWVEGEPHVVTLVTSTGLTFTSDVPVATLSPSVDGRYLSTFALLGIYAGVIPVFIGLLWLPFVRSVHRRWIDFFLSLTIGLLVFLGVDALVEAIETSERIAGAFQGAALVLLGAAGTPLVLAALAQWRGGIRGSRSPLQVAGLIALGIGLHNLGEGLAIGTSYATGEIALGTFLLIGFLLHNTTEGLGIVTPLAGERPSAGRLVLLGALAGVPTVLGAWLGGFSYSPVLTTLFFAVGVGAIVAVVYELWRLFHRRAGAGLTAPLNAAGLLLGMLIMYATGLLVPA